MFLVLSLQFNFSPKKFPFSSFTLRSRFSTDAMTFLTLPPFLLPPFNPLYCPACRQVLDVFAASPYPQDTPLGASNLYQMLNPLDVPQPHPAFFSSPFCSGLTRTFSSTGPLLRTHLRSIPRLHFIVNVLICLAVTSIFFFLVLPLPINFPELLPRDGQELFFFLKP